MPTPTRTPVDNRPIDSAVQRCSPCRWFTLSLLCADRAAARPAWWPKPLRSAYPGGAFTITLAAIAPAKQLDGSGVFDIECVSCGDATVHFDPFLRAAVSCCWPESPRRACGWRPLPASARRPRPKRGRASLRPATGSARDAAWNQLLDSVRPVPLR